MGTVELVPPGRLVSHDHRLGFLGKNGQPATTSETATPENKPPQWVVRRVSCLTNNASTRAATTNGTPLTNTKCMASPMP